MIEKHIHPKRTGQNRESVHAPRLDLVCSLWVNLMRADRITDWAPTPREFFADSAQYCDPTVWHQDLCVGIHTVNNAIVDTKEISTLDLPHRH